MEEILNENTNNSYASAWSANQGGYSEAIAKKILEFEKVQGLNINSVLDICCGSANFLEEMQKAGKTCSGTETLDTYIEYNKSKYEDIEFYKTNDILEFDNLGTFDLISCNHDVINMLPTLEDWSTFFKKAYNHLNPNGLLIFDYYTSKKLKNWNEITYTENGDVEYVKNVYESASNSTTIENIYYININTQNEPETNAMDRDYNYNNHNNKYKKTQESTIEYYFDNEDILTEIKRANFKYLIPMDFSFTPTNNLNELNRVHIIAIK